MSSSFSYKWISYFVVVFCSIAVTSQDISMTIMLNKTLTQGSKELYGDFVALNRTSTLQVKFISASKSLSFLIFQSHSFIYNVTLYNNTLTEGSYINGTNLGLYSSTKKLDTFFVYNPNEVDLRVYVSVHGYSQNDPIPGGCNMEFPVPISPFLHTTYTKDYVLVNGAAAKQLTDEDCNKATEQTVTFYRVYLPTRDYTEDTYFDGVRSMLTLDKIAENGEEVPETGVMWAMRRMLSAYAGTGAVYVAVAHSATGYSVYVPSSTYACDLLVEGDCILFDDFLTHLLCALLVFIGLFICYFGHWFFRTEMFVIGLASGGLVTYIMLAIIADLDRPALIGASLLSGVFTGAIWLIFWYYYGMPLFAVMLPTLNMGFLVAAIAYYRLPGGIEVLEEDFNFWTFYIFVMLIASVSLISMTFLSNILCCAILGAYAIVFSIDCYIGSNLKYILINILRRAIVPKFNWAVLSPPFELNEALLTALWVALALSGSLVQHCRSRGRPPFPPPPRSLRPRLAALSATVYRTGPPQPIYAYEVPTGHIVPPGHFVPPVHIVPSATVQPNVTERTPLLS